MSERIYFDNSATTPLDPRVIDEMLPFLGKSFGNPSSLHAEGRSARQAVDTARARIAQLFNARASEIIFTASGTEADNMALVGVVQASHERENHIITSAIEHPAIIETCRYLETRGVEVTYLAVTPQGLVEPAELQRALRPHTRLVSVMAANNVVGTLQPIAQLAQITRAHGALFHTDAVQAAGKIPIDTRATPIDLLSMSAHKLNGPKGVGALYIREGTHIKPLVHGGGQEHGLRSATENVAGIVGMGAAAEYARLEMSAEATHLVKLRDQLIETITQKIPNAFVIGHRYRRLPGHICLGLDGQEGEVIKLMLALDEAGISISTGSACSAHHATEPSSILRAMGFDPIRARGSLRITLGRFNTQDEVNRFLDIFPQVVASMRPVVSFQRAVA